jgi:hypothetical protein
MKKEKLNTLARWKINEQTEGRDKTPLKHVNRRIIIAI